MRKILVTLVFLHGVTAHSQSSAAAKETTYASLKQHASKVDKRGLGLTFDKTVKIYKNGKLFLVRGHVYFFKDTGKVSSMTGVQNTQSYFVGGQTVTFRNWISFSKNGGVTFGIGAKNVTFKVGKHTIKYKTTTPKGYSAKMFFYDSGAVKDIHIYDDHDIKVKNRTYRFAHQCGCGGDLQFYENGKLKGGYLAKDTLIDGISFKKGSRVQFTQLGNLVLPNGKRSLPAQTFPLVSKRVKTTYFSDVKKYGSSVVTSQKYYVVLFSRPVDLYVKSRRLRAKGTVYFHKYSETVWNIETLIKAEPIKVGSHTITFKKYISFTKKGQVSFGYPTQDLTLRIKRGTVVYKTSTGRKSANISFYPSGALRGMQLSGNVKIVVVSQKLEFAPRFSYFSNDLEFYPGGELKLGYLAAAKTIHGRSFKKGAKVEFTAKGALKK